MGEQRRESGAPRESAHLSVLPLSLLSLKPCIAGEAVLSRRAVLALSVPLGLGSDAITLNLPLSQRYETELNQKKRENRDGHKGQCLIKGMAVGKSRTKPFPLSECPLVSLDGHPTGSQPGCRPDHPGKEGLKGRRWPGVGEKQTGCLGPVPDPSPGQPGMAITGPLLAAPRAIKTGELREPSAQCR